MDATVTSRHAVTAVEAYVRRSYLEQGPACVVKTWLVAGPDASHEMDLVFESAFARSCTSGLLSRIPGRGDVATVSLGFAAAILAEAGENAGQVLARWMRPEQVSGSRVRSAAGAARHCRRMGRYVLEQEPARAPVVLPYALFAAAAGRGGCPTPQVMAPLRTVEPVQALRLLLELNSDGSGDGGGTDPDGSFPDQGGGDIATVAVAVAAALNGTGLARV